MTHHNIRTSRHGAAARPRLPEAVAAFVTILWLGLVLGVSFIATPVKFQAPSLSLPVALEIGRATFALFSKIELGMAMLLTLSILACNRRALSTILGAALITIVVVETVWLLPVLDERVEIILSGTAAPAGWYHFFYVGIETLKAVLLVALSAHLLRQLTATNAETRSE
ncbi:hypothetical protein PZ897_14130 [Hoeflea sp. YIM 152468]|uniref:hypothetical protein n=1 Tax=Hoeflea sp. YIM 152468 TaxID=3031759 RepID=UPI0023DCE315|nr:hypothetical protein [Hoeflea sp. YIM 152468]MDF1609321.1 hypothetical protein [Hoeflea sp. YIM 152468]